MLVSGRRSQVGFEFKSLAGRPTTRGTPPRLARRSRGDARLYTLTRVCHSAGVDPGVASPPRRALVVLARSSARLLLVWVSVV